MNAITVLDPVSSDILYEITDISTAQARIIMEQARTAAQKLRMTTIDERCAAVKKAVDYIMKEREAILDQIVSETGKSRTDAFLTDLFQVVEDCDWLIKNSKRVLKDKSVATPMTMMGKKCRIYNEPHGVALVISPWNMPLALGLNAVMTAFIAGNAVIFKPSEITPLKDLFETIFEQSALLDQSISRVHGGGATAQSLISLRPDIISFTGSVNTGQRILAQAAEMVIPVILELGAKDFMIVFEDANLKRAIPAAVWGALLNGGQACTSTENLYVHESLYPEFVDGLRREVQQLIVNSGDNGDADVGGITAAFQLEIIKQQVADAQAKGAVVIEGGQVLGRKNSAFYAPTIITHLDTSMDMWHKETFGPIIAVHSFSTEEEIIAKHNQTDFGLSASLWTSDKNRADRVSRALVVGCVNINNVNMTEANPALPFGGVKYSGYGRAKGEEGLLGMTRSKAVVIDKMSSKREANWYPYSHLKLSALDKLLNVLHNKKGLSRLFGIIITGLTLEFLATKKRK